MKKCSLAMAVVAVLPGLAQADVTFSGSLSAGFTSDSSALTNFVRQVGVDDFGSKIRMTGEEDLGNGLKVLFKIESGFNADGIPTGSYGQLASRQTYLGLSHDRFGLIRMGYINDVLGDTEATDNLGYGRRDFYGGVPLYEEGFQPGSFSFPSGDGRLKNSIRWESPVWGGFSAILQYAAGENASQNTSSQDYWAYRVGYQTPGAKWFVNFAQEQLRHMVANHHGLDTRLEAGYNGEALSFAVTYGHQSMYANTTANGGWNVLGINNVASHLTGNAWAFYAACVLGRWKPQIVLSQLKNQTIDGQAFNGGARQAAASIVYQLSRATTAELGYGVMFENAGYQSVSNHASSKSDQAWLQFTHKF